MPDNEQMSEGLENLASHGNRVNYIVTHDGPTGSVKKLAQMRGFDIAPDKLNEYLEQIRTSVTYDAWVFGHHHLNRRITDKDTVLYDQVLRLV